MIKKLFSQKIEKNRILNIKIFILFFFVLCLGFGTSLFLKQSNAIQMTPPISNLAQGSNTALEDSDFELLTICVQPNYGLEQGCLIAQLNTTPLDINGPEFIGPFFEHFDWAWFSQNMGYAEKCGLISFFEDWFQVDNLNDYGIDEDCI